MVDQDRKGEKPTGFKKLEMPRKTRLTPALRDRIIEQVKAGNFIEPSARAVGVPASTLYLWLRLGREGRRPFMEFVELLDAAQAQAELRVVGHLQTAIPTNWRAAIRWLEAHAGKRWGTKDANVSKLSPESWQDATVEEGESEVPRDSISEFLVANPDRIPAVLAALGLIQAEMDAVAAERQPRLDVDRTAGPITSPLLPIALPSLDERSR